MPHAADLAHVTVRCQFETQLMQPPSLKMMNPHPSATPTQKYAFDLHVSRLQLAFILSQYLPRAKAGRDHSPRFCCFLPLDSPTDSTSALHPHPAQAPQNWPCRTGPVRTGSGVSITPNQECKQILLHAGMPCRKPDMRVCVSVAAKCKSQLLSMTRSVYRRSACSPELGGRVRE